MEQYYTISNDTLEIKDTSKLTFSNLFKLINEIDKVLLNNPNITKIISYDIFSLDDYTNYNYEGSTPTNLIIEQFSSILQNNTNITYLQIKNFESYMYKYFRSKYDGEGNYSIKCAANFLQSLSKTNIKTLIIDNLKTNKNKKCITDCYGGLKEHIDNGGRVEYIYVDENAALFERKLKELAETTKFRVIKFNDTYVINIPIECDDKNVDLKISKSFNIDIKKDSKLILDIKNYYNSFFNNIDNYIEKVLLIINSLNIQINRFDLIKELIEKYKKQFNSLNEFDNFINDYKLIKLNFDINTTDSYYILNKINDIYDYYISLKTKNIFTNINDFINDFKEKIKMFEIENDTFSIQKKIYSKIISTYNTNELEISIFNDISVSGNDKKINIFKHFLNLDINKLNIKDEDLYDITCETLYKYWNKSIVDLSISVNHIENIVLLTNILLNNKNINSLTFKSVEFFTNGIDFLRNIIKHSSIKELHFINCKFNLYRSFKKLYKALKNNNNIKKLTIYFNNLNYDIQLYYIFKLLNNNKDLVINISSKFTSSLFYNDYINDDNKNRLIII